MFEKLLLNVVDASIEPQEEPQEAIGVRIVKSIAKSPSQTTEWLECPIKRMLRTKIGLSPRRVTKGDIAAIGGRGFAKAMESYNRSRLQTGTMESKNDCIEAGLYEVKKAKDHWLERGREVPSYEMAYFNSIESRLARTIEKYLADDILRLHQIEDVELTLPDHGNARIDLGCRDNFGLIVIDYKYKLRLDPQYLTREIDKYKNSWQQFHYCWAYGEYKHEEVTRYGICLVIGEPKFSVQLIEYPIHPETMEMWKHSADRIWRQMDHEDVGLSEPWMAAEHSTKYGPCPYQAACFTHRYDMNLMLKEDYILDKDDE